MVVVDWMRGVSNRWSGGGDDSRSVAERWASGPEIGSGAFCGVGGRGSIKLSIESVCKAG